MRTLQYSGRRIRLVHWFSTHYRIDLRPSQRLAILHLLAGNDFEIKVCRCFEYEDDCGAEVELSERLAWLHRDTVLALGQVVGIDVTALLVPSPHVRVQHLQISEAF